MLFRITQRRIHSICFFWPPLCFSVVECVLPSIFNSKCKIQTQPYRSERLKFLLALLIPLAHSNASAPSWLLFSSSPCCSIYPPFLHPHSSPLFLSHLSVPPCLIPAFVFQYTTLEDTKKNQELLQRLLFSKVPHQTLCYFYFRIF